ncbi:MAG: hypothetical protein K1V99_06105 [Bacteroidales bacterium]
MIKVSFKNKIYAIPTRWSELNQIQFMGVSEAMERFESGNCDFEEFKIMTTVAILQLNTKIMRPTDALYENLFRISEKLDFPYTIEEKHDSREVSLRVILDRQILPQIYDYQGYEFSCRDGMAETSMSAERYVDAISLMQLYSKKRSDIVLDRLTAVLYAGSPYGIDSVKSVNAGEIPHRLKIAVYYNFRGILEWIKRLPKYDILYNGTGSGNTAGSPMGLEGSIYTLAKSGYGSYNDICNVNLFTYLDLLLDQSIESVRTLKGAGLKPTEIAEKMHLHPEQIMNLI